MFWIWILLLFGFYTKGIVIIRLGLSDFLWFQVLALFTTYCFLNILLFICIILLFLLFLLYLILFLLFIIITTLVYLLIINIFFLLLILLMLILVLILLHLFLHIIILLKHILHLLCIAFYAVLRHVQTSSTNFASIKWFIIK
mgnify:CR=1 FL=1